MAELHPAVGAAALSSRRPVGGGSSAGVLPTAAGWSPETGVSIKPDADRTFSVISSWLVKASEADCRAPEPERAVFRERREQWRSSTPTPYSWAPLGGPGCQAIQHAVHAISKSHRFLPKVSPNLTQGVSAGREQTLCFGFLPCKGKVSTTKSAARPPSPRFCLLVTPSALIHPKCHLHHEQESADILPQRSFDDGFPLSPPAHSRRFHT